jgi:hypothetical protein
LGPVQGIALDDSGTLWLASGIDVIAVGTDGRIATVVNPPTPADLDLFAVDHVGRLLIGVTYSGPVGGSELIAYDPTTGAVKHLSAPPGRLPEGCVVGETCAPRVQAVAVRDNGWLVTFASWSGIAGSAALYIIDPIAGPAPPRRRRSHLARRQRHPCVRARRRRPAGPGAATWLRG